GLFSRPDPRKPRLLLAGLSARYAHRCVAGHRPRTHHCHVAAHHLCAAEQTRSEEHTSELQSRENLVCRLLLEKKKKTKECQIKNHQNQQKARNTQNKSNIVKPKKSGIQEAKQLEKNT